MSNISNVGVNIAEKATLIWNVADMLRGPFKPHEYGKVILPMTVLKRFDDALKTTKAAVVEMVMTALPEIAKNVAEPLSKVDKITMYGEGNSAKLLSDIVNGTTQVTEGISAGMGIDIKSLILGALGGKMAAGENAAPVVVPVAPVQPEAQQ